MRRAAVVVAQVRGVSALVGAFGAAEGIARVLDLQRAARGAFAGAEQVTVDPVAVTGVFAAREAALDAALAAHRAMRQASPGRGFHLHGPLVAVALGYGEILVEDCGPYGAEPALARRLAAFVPAGAEVVTTDAFLGALALPEGLGAHVGAQAYVNAIGAPFHVLADFRD